MRYSERKEFLYEPELFQAYDTQIALRIHDEYVRKGSAKPQPKFFEVDRDNMEIDPVLHYPLASRTPFTPRSKEGLCLYSIVTFEKPAWTLLRIGLTPQQRYKIWLSNLALKEFDYFPTRGDFVYYNGYRLFITRCAPDPEAYWQQTGVWLGITADAQVYSEGDSAPLGNVGQAAPAEISSAPPETFGPSVPGPLPFPTL